MFVGERYGLAGQCSAMYMSVERRADALHLTRTAPLRAYLPAIGGAVGAGIVVQVVSSWLLPAVLLLLVALALLPENEECIVEPRRVRMRNWTILQVILRLRPSVRVFSSPGEPSPTLFFVRERETVHHFR
eukprot:m.855478 g.855478  ORF g.855478 m.855478 type:complete len:131 (-) comp59625_c0_seq18:2227-2619(-)